MSEDPLKDSSCYRATEFSLDGGDDAFIEMMRRSRIAASKTDLKFAAARVIEMARNDIEFDLNHKKKRSAWLPIVLRIASRFLSGDSFYDAGWLNVAARAYIELEATDYDSAPTYYSNANAGRPGRPDIDEDWLQVSLLYRFIKTETDSRAQQKLLLQYLDWCFDKYRRDDYLYPDGHYREKPFQPGSSNMPPRFLRNWRRSGNPAPPSKNTIRDWLEIADPTVTEIVQLCECQCEVVHAPQFGKLDRPEYVIFNTPIKQFCEALTANRLSWKAELRL